jgi:hypothetical protein
MESVQESAPECRLKTRIESAARGQWQARLQCSAGADETKKAARAAFDPLHAE